VYHNFITFSLGLNSVVIEEKISSLLY